MTLNAVVSDTGPLISLEKLSGGYGWMKQLYGQILIPDAVAEELYQGMFSSWEAYRSHYGLGNFVAVVEVADEATFPGCELLDMPLLIEEEQGRQAAKVLGLTFSGLAGQILKAHREQIISLAVAQTSLAELLKAGRIGKKLYAGLLEALN